jgi:hypothetical protein
MRCDSIAKTDFGFSFLIDLGLFFERWLGDIRSPSPFLIVNF